MVHADWPTFRSEKIKMMFLIIIIIVYILWCLKYKNGLINVILAMLPGMQIPHSCCHRNVLGSYHADIHGRGLLGEGLDFIREVINHRDSTLQTNCWYSLETGH